MKVTQHLVIEKTNEERCPGQEEEEAQRESCLCLTPKKLPAGSRCRLEELGVARAGSRLACSPSGVVSSHRPDQDPPVWKMC